MTHALLTTKLTSPPPRTAAVQRPHLVERLNQGLGGRLTLLSAPAGFGKTTLIREWVHQSEIPTCWLSLDENDNDPGRFLAYLVAALGRVGIEADFEGINFLQNPGRDQTETLLTGVINQVAEAGTRFGVVLDDYHLIQNQEVHQVTAYLLEHLPPGVHLVIATRADPPLPVARLRARGELTELRSGTLRFLLPEGEAFLNQVFGLGLRPEDVKVLMARTDGWPAGLQLASIALRGREDPSGYIQRFSGSHDYIVDFLTAEVLEGQSEDTRSFLLNTAILNRLSAPLCAAVTGQGNAREILKELRANNIFLGALDDEGRWYAYHQLFRDLLTQQLVSKHPEAVPGLTLKASTWCQENGLVSEAIDYALAGSHLDRAADLIAGHAQAALQQSEVVTFIRWMEKLPDAAVQDRPELGIFYAWALLISNRSLETAAQVMDQVRTEDAVTLGKLKAVRSIQAAMQRDIPRSIELAREALAMLPAEAAFFRQITGWNLSAALFLAGETVESTEILAEVARVSLEGGSPMVAVVTLCRLGSIRTQQGDLHQAYSYYQQALEAASQDRDRPVPAACEALLGLGKIEWEWYQFEAAAQNLSAGLELSKRWREVASVEGRITLAHLLVSQGDFEGADRRMAEAQTIAANQIFTETGRAYVNLQGAYLRLRQGDLPYAHIWADKRELEKYIQAEALEITPIKGADLIRDLELGVFARILMAEARYPDALALLSMLLPAFGDLGHRAKIIETHVLMAAVQEAMGKREDALESLQTALVLAAPANYRRVFLEEGLGVIRNLRGIQAQGDPTGFARKILASAWDGDAAGPGATGPVAVEPLSEREQEILRLLVSDLPVPEMAADLHISVSTLRTHIRNIYRKLGAHSRFEAVMKGEEMEIL